MCEPVKPKNLTKRDFDLLCDSLDEMECMFWACDGPTLRPKHMVTCRCCHLSARLAKRLGIYIPKKERDWNGEEWTKQNMERRRKEARAILGLGF